MEHFIERVQIRKANCNSAEEKREKKNGANIAELRAKRKTLTQQSGDDGQKKKKNAGGSSGGWAARPAMFGLTLPPSVFRAAAKLS